MHRVMVWVRGQDFNFEELRTNIRDLSDGCVDLQLVDSGTGVHAALVLTNEGTLEGDDAEEILSDWI